MYVKDTLRKNHCTSFNISNLNNAIKVFINQTNNIIGNWDCNNQMLRNVDYHIRSRIIGRRFTIVTWTFFSLKPLPPITFVWRHSPAIFAIENVWPVIVCRITPIITWKLHFHNTNSFTFLNHFRRDRTSSLSSCHRRKNSVFRKKKTSTGKATNSCWKIRYLGERGWPKPESKHQ